MANRPMQEQVSEAIDHTSSFWGAGPEAFVETKGRSASLWLQNRPSCVRSFQGAPMNILVLTLRGGGYVERIKEGRAIWRGPAVGTATVLDARNDSEWQLEGTFEQLHVYLEPDTNSSKYSSIAGQPFRDPMLMHLGNAASMLLRRQGDEGESFGAILQSMQVYVSELQSAAAQKKPYITGGLSLRYHHRLDRFIDDNLGREVRIADLAQITGLSIGHFNRAFKASFGISPHQYLIDRRVVQASLLLKDAELPLPTISSICGFSSLSHLGTHFKRRFGVTLGEYRRGILPLMPQGRA